MENEIILSFGMLITKESLMKSQIKLIKTRGFTINKRSMHTTKNLVNKALTVNSNHFKGSLTRRTYASMHMGKFKPSSQLVQHPITDSGSPIECDVSGYHENVIASVCPKPGCKVTNCADIKKTDPNPCGETPTYHQAPITNHFLIEHKLIGAATHKIPSHMSGVIIDHNTDIQNKPKPQAVALEKNTTTINTNEFQENKNATNYVQNNNRTTPLLYALPSDTIP